MSEMKADLLRAQELEGRELRIPPLQQVLGGTFVVTEDMPSLLSFDANGAGRNVDMPAEELPSMNGKIWIINNLTAATHALTVRNDAGGTIQSIAATKTAIIAVINGTWRVLSLVA